MKQLITLLFFSIPLFSFADAWDNLTFEEAENVVKELKKNPFIFDYCDCCDYKGEYASSIEFIKVTDTEIVECNWNSEMYSVKITSELIASVQFTASGANTKEMTKQSDNNFSSVLYMNYTWGLNPETKKATPFFNIITYSFYENENQPCQAEFKYPTPRDLKKVNFVKGYKKWWRVNVRD